MGHLSAMDMVAHAPSVDAALSWHLASNHYPPIPAAMVAVAKRAIQNAKRGDWDKRIKLPAGISHRVTGRYATTRAAVEHMHLDAFLEDGEDDA